MARNLDPSTARIRSTDRRWLAVAVLAVAQFMVFLDETVVNVALPSIKGDLGFSESSLAWVVNAYILVFGGLLLLGGRDRKSTRLNSSNITISYAVFCLKKKKKKKKTILK